MTYLQDLKSSQDYEYAREIICASNIIVVTMSRVRVAVVAVVQGDFLVERLGGPKLYTQRKGKHYRLIARHSPYDLNPRSAARWLEV